MKHLIFTVLALVTIFFTFDSNERVVEKTKIEVAQYRKKPKTVKVKSHIRHSKSGKVSRVRSYKRSK